MRSKKSAVDCSEVAQPHLVKSFERSQPQADVGVDGVFDKDRNLSSFERLGDLLDVKGVDRGARSDPYSISFGGQGALYMLGVAHLYDKRKANLCAHYLQPF